jgi:hypothetical protein
MSSSVGAAHRTSDVRRPRQPQQPCSVRITENPVALIDWDESHVDVPDLDLVLPPQPPPVSTTARTTSRASVGRMGVRRLLGRRVRSPAACRSSSGLSRGGAL